MTLLLLYITGVNITLEWVGLLILKALLLMLFLAYAEPQARLELGLLDQLG